MKIKVIFTGGTIGSSLKDGFLASADAPLELLKDCDCDFDIDEPYEILSEELTSERLLILSKSVDSALEEADAMIITHGTDTLSYSAAFLGYVFADCKKPIVLVSSAYPLSDERENGRENFKAAIDFSKLGIGGVYAVWHSNGVTNIHIGTRLLQQQAYSDELESVGLSFGRVEDGKFVGKCADFERSAVPMLKEMVFSSASLDGFGRVLDIPARPDLYYPELDEKASAVLFESYHSGTMCVDENFNRFAKSAAALEIPIFVCGTSGREVEYETVKKYAETGAIPLSAASPAAMYVKLSLACSFYKGTDEIKEFMQRPCGGDFFD